MQTFLVSESKRHGCPNVSVFCTCCNCPMYERISLNGKFKFIFNANEFEISEGTLSVGLDLSGNSSAFIS